MRCSYFIRLWVTLVFTFQCLEGNSSQEKDTPSILYIQDAHCVASAQENIVKIIERHYKTRNPNHDSPLWIATEGAYGPVSTSFLKSFPYERGRKTVTRSLLQKGLLTGPEALAIRHPEIQINIWGIEDPKLYVKNFLFFRKAIHQWQEGKTFRSRFDELLKNIRKKIYSKSNLKWTQKLLDFRERKTGIFEITPFLLAEKLPKPTLKKIIKLHVKHRHAIRQKVNTFDWERSAKEIEKMMEGHLSQTLQTSSEVDLWRFEKYYHLTRQALQLQLSRNKWHSLEQMPNFNQESIRSFLHTAEMTPHEILEFQKGLNTLQNSLSLVKDFYKGAMERDLALTHNFEKLLRFKKPKKIILITGGFHREPFLEQFKKMGKSYSVIQPKISGKQIHKIYWSRMLDKRIPEKNTYAIAFVSVLNTLLELITQEGTQAFRDTLMSHFIDWMRGNGVNVQEALQKWPKPNLPDPNTEALIDSLARMAKTPLNNLPKRGIDVLMLRQLLEMGGPISALLDRYLAQTGEKKPPINTLADEVGAPIIFSTPKNPSQKYRLRAEIEETQNNEKNPQYRIVVETAPKNEDEPSYPVAIATGFLIDDNGIAYLDWIITLDYPEIWERIKNFLPKFRVHIAKERLEIEPSLINAMAYYPQYHPGPNPEFSAQVKFMHNLLFDHAEDFSDKAVQAFFENAPKSLRRKGLSDSILEFLSSFIPIGSDIEFSIANQPTLKALRSGTPFEETLLGQWWGKHGYKPLLRFDEVMAGLPAYVLRKVQDVPTRTIWEKPIPPYSHADDLHRSVILEDHIARPLLDQEGKLSSEEIATLSEILTAVLKIKDKLSQTASGENIDKDVFSRANVIVDLLIEEIETRLWIEEHTAVPLTDSQKEIYHTRGIIYVEDSRVETPQFKGFIRRLRNEQGLVEIEIHVDKGPLLLINSSSVRLYEEGKPPIELKPSREKLGLSLHLAALTGTPLKIPIEPLANFPLEKERLTEEESYLDSIFNIPSIFDDIMEWRKVWLYYRFYCPMEAGAGLAENNVEVKNIPDPHLAHHIREKIMNAFSVILEVKPAPPLERLHRTILEQMTKKFIGNRSPPPRIIFTLDPNMPTGTAIVFYDPKMNTVHLQLKSLDRTRDLTESFLIRVILYAFSRSVAHWDFPFGPPMPTETIPLLEDLKKFITKNRKGVEGPSIARNIRAKLQDLARGKRRVERERLYPDILQAANDAKEKGKKLEDLFGRLSPPNQSLYVKLFTDLKKETQDLEIDLNTALELDDEIIFRSAASEIRAAIRVLIQELNRLQERIYQTLSAQIRERTRTTSPTERTLSYYEILGVSKKATSEDIKRAYRALSRRWHPDLNPGNKGEAERRMKKINEAYDTLSDPTKRNNYDQSGRSMHLIARGKLYPLVEKLPSLLQDFYREALKTISGRLELRGSGIHLHPVLVEFLSTLEFLATEGSDLDTIRKRYRFTREDILHEIAHISLSHFRTENGLIWRAAKDQIQRFSPGALVKAWRRFQALYDVTLDEDSLIEELAAKRVTYWVDPQRNVELAELFVNMDQTLISKLDTLLKYIGFEKGAVSQQTLRRLKIEFGITSKSSKEYNQVLWKILFSNPRQLTALYSALNERGQAQSFRRLLRQVMPVTESVLDTLVELDVPPEFLILVLEHILLTIGTDSSLAQRLLHQFIDRHPEIAPLIATLSISGKIKERLGIHPKTFDIIQQAA